MLLLDLAVIQTLAAAFKLGCSTSNAFVDNQFCGRMQKKNPGGAPPPPDPADDRMAKLKAFAAAKSRSFSRAMSGLSFSINAGARDYGVYGPDAIELDDLANEAKVPEGVNDVSPEVQQPVHQTVQRRAGQRRAQPAAAQQNRADDRRRQKCLFIVLAILIGGALSGSGIFGVKKLLADKEAKKPSSVKEVIIPGNEADFPDNESKTPDKKADIPPDNEADTPDKKADIPPVDGPQIPDSEANTPPVKGGPLKKPDVTFNTSGPWYNRNMKVLISWP
eukprot:210605_1